MTNARPSFMRILGNLFVALVGAYGLSVTGFLLARALLSDDFWPIALFNSFAHILFMPALVLIPLCLLLRRVRVIVLLLPALVAFLLSYGGLFVPRTPRVVADDVPRFSLVTYNLKAQSSNLDPLIRVIREADADIIALQELGEAVAQRLEAELQDLYPHQALHPQPDPAFTGQGLLSRYPITSDDYWLINYGHQRAEIDLDGQALVVYNTHPTPPFVSSNLISRGYVERRQEVIDVLSRIANEPVDLPLVLAGDLNLTDQSADYWRIAEQLIDTHREIGWGMGFTFPNFGATKLSWLFLPPLARIDYVFHNTHLQGVETRILPETGGSDHHPVYVTLALISD